MFLRAAGKDGNADAIAEIIWFFQFIARQDQDLFRRRLRTVDRKMEQLALSSQIWQLSVRVLKKHWYVNIGFVLTGISLLSLLIGAIGYIVRVHR